MFLNQAQFIGLIGSCTGWGAKVRGTRDGPRVFEAYLQSLDGFHNQDYFRWMEMVDVDVQDSVPVGELTLPYVIDEANRLGRAVTHVMEQKGFPVVIGGDHAASIGTWRAMQACYDLPIGLIWVDAHMDSHVPETSPSHAYHGMVLAALMGYGDSRWVNGCGEARFILPQNVVIIGVRSYEAAEWALLQKWGVKVYFMDTVKENGFSNILLEAIENLTQRTAGVGISFDLDVLDPLEMPGVGSPAPGGVSVQEAIEALKHLDSKEALIGLEFVEYNPHLDKSGVGLKVIANLILNKTFEI